MEVTPAMATTRSVSIPPHEQHPITFLICFGQISKSNIIHSSTFLNLSSVRPTSPKFLLPRLTFPPPPAVYSFSYFQPAASAAPSQAETPPKTRWPSSTPQPTRTTSLSSTPGRATPPSACPSPRRCARPAPTGPPHRKTLCRSARRAAPRRIGRCR